MLANTFYHRLSGVHWAPSILSAVIAGKSRADQPTFLPFPATALACPSFQNPAGYRNSTFACFFCFCLTSPPKYHNVRPRNDANWHACIGSLSSQAVTDPNRSTSFQPAGYYLAFAIVAEQTTNPPRIEPHCPPARITPAAQYLGTCIVTRHFDTSSYSLFKSVDGPLVGPLLLPKGINEQERPWAIIILQPPSQARQARPEPRQMIRRARQAQHRHPPRAIVTITITCCLTGRKREIILLHTLPIALPPRQSRPSPKQLARLSSIGQRACLAQLCRL